MAAIDGLHLLNLVESKTRTDIKRFVDASRHTKVVGEVAYMKWVADAMELMNRTKLNNKQKKALVVALYKDLSKDDTNEYKEDFDVNSAVEFIWDAANDRFGIILRNTGCLSRCFPSCIKQVSAVSDQGKIKINVEAPDETITLKEPKVMAEEKTRG